MDHAEAERLLDLYADAELDRSVAQRFESHLAECEICAGRLRRLKADRTVLALALARAPAPPGLRAKILNDIRDAARLENNRRITPSPWMRYAATIAATALLTGATTLALTRHAGRESVADAVFNDQARALATRQVIEVASSGGNAARARFDDRLSYVPPVRDFKEKGFPLLGSRVDYVDGQPVAVLVYGPRLISVFLRPVRRDQWPAHVITRRGGFNIAWWSNGTFECWAISDVSAGDLLRLRKLFLRGQEGSRL